MDYIGSRNSLVEERIEECLSAAERGESETSMECGDLRDEESRYVQEEVRRRLEKGHLG